MTPPSRDRGRRAATVAAFALAALAFDRGPRAGPGRGFLPPAPAAPMDGTVTLYTSVTAGHRRRRPGGASPKQRPDLPVEVFRAPTGELDARIASETRSGGSAPTCSG